MLKIIPMTEEHRAEVLKMMQTFYTSPAVATDGSPEIFASDINECLSTSPYLEGFIFDDNGRTAGYSMIAKSFSTEYGRRCVWIEDIYLKPEYRGRGAAGLLFRFLEEKYPGTLLRLEVEDDNTPAVRAYGKNGFTVMGYTEMKKNCNKKGLTQISPLLPLIQGIFYFMQTSVHQILSCNPEHCFSTGTRTTRLLTLHTTS